MTAKNVPVHIGRRTLGDCEFADADQERHRNGQIVRYVGIKRLKNRVIVGIDAADFRLRANRMMVMKMKVEEAGVRMLLIFLMLMEMQKWRLNERKRQHEGCQDRGQSPHTNILHMCVPGIWKRTPAQDMSL